MSNSLLPVGLAGRSWGSLGSAYGLDKRVALVIAGVFVLAAAARWVYLRLKSLEDRVRVLEETGKERLELSSLEGKVSFLEQTKAKTPEQGPQERNEVRIPTTPPPVFKDSMKRECKESCQAILPQLPSGVQYLFFATANTPRDENLEPFCQQFLEENRECQLPIVVVVVYNSNCVEQGLTRNLLEAVWRDPEIGKKIAAIVHMEWYFGAIQKDTFFETALADIRRAVPNRI